MYFLHSSVSPNAQTVGECLCVHSKTLWQCKGSLKVCTRLPKAAPSTLAAISGELFCTEVLLGGGTRECDHGRQSLCHSIRSRQQHRSCVFKVFNSPSGMVLLGTSWGLKNKPTVKDCNLSLVYRKIAVKGLGQREGVPGSLTVG